VILHDGSAIALKIVYKNVLILFLVQRISYTLAYLLILQNVLGIPYHVDEARLDSVSEEIVSTKYPTFWVWPISLSGQMPLIFCRK